MSTACRQPPRRVLLVEDDVHIAEIARLHLADEGFAVTHAADGNEGERLLNTEQWDAVVLDIMLPGVDGLALCRRAREGESYTPVIITSARSGEVHRILGLELGADDYLAKPYSVLELVARVRALLRRADALARRGRPSGAVVVGSLRIEPAAREAFLGETALDLTPREFDLLELFARHPGEVFSRADLLDRVWGHRYDGYEHTVNTHINRLRGKIEVDPATPERLLTVWGRGYKLGAV